MWILLVTNALALAALLVIVWRLQQAKLIAWRLQQARSRTHVTSLSQRSALDEFPSEDSLEPLRRVS
jgi:hypothetical protein